MYHIPMNLHDSHWPGFDSRLMHFGRAQLRASLTNRGNLGRIPLCICAPTNTSCALPTRSPGTFPTLLAKFCTLSTHFPHTSRPLPMTVYRGLRHGKAVYCLGDTAWELCAVMFMFVRSYVLRVSMVRFPAVATFILSSCARLGACPEFHSPGKFARRLCIRFSPTRPPGDYDPSTPLE